MSVSVILKSIKAVTNIKEPKIFLIIILLSSLTGILIIESNEYKFFPDSVGYHNMAINILENGEHSNFFREPGYPYFLAVSYKLFSLFGGKPSLINENEYIVEDRLLTASKPEIHFVKYIQLILIIVSIILFYKIIKLFFHDDICNFTALICSIYYPLISSSQFILREPLLLITVSLMSYSIILYLTRNKIMFLLIASFLIGIGALIFQVMISLFLTVIIAVLLSPQQKLRSKLSILILNLAVLSITIAPWCNKVYRYYPDVRVVTTIGCSLTHQSITYIQALRDANSRGLIDDRELSRLHHSNWYSLSDHELFERSFNGWYLSKADSLNKIKPRSFISRTKIKSINLSKYFLRIFRHKYYFPFNRWGNLDSLDKVFRVFMELLSYLFAVTSFLGLLIFPKRKLYIFMPQMMFVSLFFILGSETRRFIPSFTFIIFLSAYFIKHKIAPIINSFLISRGKLYEK